MKITRVATLVSDEAGKYTFPLVVGTKTKSRVVQFSLQHFLKDDSYDPDHSEPVQISDIPEGSMDGFWLFRRSIIQVTAGDSAPREEILTRIKHAVLREEQAFARVAREVQAFENMDNVPSARREQIPESVRLFVWQRDEGKCVKCGSRERLEFDRIIPIALGGSNTERNIQLLCERCNREKGKSV